LAENEPRPPTDVDYTDPRIGIYVPVPPSSIEGVCGVCHGASIRGQLGTFFPNCWNCRDIPPGGTRVVVPISLARKQDSQLYDMAKGYKSGYVHDDVRRQHAVVLASTLQRFLRLHETCIARAAGGTQWDTVTIVPSARSGREGIHPLERVIALSTTLGPICRRLLTPTGQQIQRDRANPGAFVAGADANGARVLIVDDTMTTGTSVQSAAAALTSGGAHVVGAVVICRLVDTDHGDKDEYWHRQSAARFDFGICCLE
jgi:hypothetical protein